MDIAPFVPLVLGTIPVCSGTRQLSSMEQSVMGALSVAGTIQITQDPQTAQYMFNYILSLLKVVNGASARNGKLSEDEIKKLLMALMGKWLEASGPGFTSYKQLLMDLMQNATLQDFMKGMQDAVCAITGDPVNANTGNFIYEKKIYWSKAGFRSGSNVSTTAPTKGQEPWGRDGGIIMRFSFCRNKTDT